MQIADWIDQEVDVVEYIHTGHHQHEIRYEGKLLAINGHMILVDVEHVYDDEGETARGGFKCWFNTVASAFGRITQDNSRKG